MIRSLFGLLNYKEDEVQTIRIYDKTITEYPEKLYQLGVKELCLDGFHVEEFPDFSRLIELKCISLDKIPAKIIPSNINLLTNIKSITFCKMGIKNIPDELYQLTQLEQLILENNGIEYISESICNLFPLKFLSLRRNEIKEIRFTLYDIENVDLCHNQLRILPEISNIEDIYIFGNEFQFITYEESTDIYDEESYNKIKEIELKNMYHDKKSARK